MSLLLPGKYVVTLHIHLGVLSGFFIISFNKIVNVTWDDEIAFDKKIGTLSVSCDFHFWDLVNAAFSSSTVVFPHSCYFNFPFPFSIFPIQLADKRQAFFSPHISFQNFFILSIHGTSFTMTWFFPVSL